MISYLLILKRRARGFFEYELIEERSGFISILFRGSGVKQLFQNEAGGHRIQRIPPTEKRGRIHTSTITVAVLDPESSLDFSLNESEIEITATTGTGPGGQHRNKTQSCIVAKHVPTGITVRADMRSQYQSKSIALRILSAKLKEIQYDNLKCERDSLRKKQVGSGQRADKIRTYREKDDKVVDHVTGKTWKMSRWLKGDWD